MQDEPVMNAGLGSNLTEAGVVQCDASLMAGNGAFGAVGAAPGALRVIMILGSRIDVALGLDVSLLL